MFTRRDKIKEYITNFVKSPLTQCVIYQNNHYKPVGVSVVMSYKYVIGDTEVMYDKWYVEGFDMAQQMNLPGCEHHDKLVRGSGVTALSKKFGSVVFYGKPANEIINACEINRDIESYIIHNNVIKQK